MWYNFRFPSESSYPSIENWNPLKLRQYEVFRTTSQDTSYIFVYMINWYKHFINTKSFLIVLSLSSYQIHNLFGLTNDTFLIIMDESFLFPPKFRIFYSGTVDLAINMGRSKFIRIFEKCIIQLCFLFLPGIGWSRSRSCFVLLLQLCTLLTSSGYGATFEVSVMIRKVIITSTFHVQNSNPKIIQLNISLLRNCDSHETNSESTYHLNGGILAETKFDNLFLSMKNV